MCLMITMLSTIFYFGFDLIDYLLSTIEPPVSLTVHTPSRYTSDFSWIGADALSQVLGQLPDKDLVNFLAVSSETRALGKIHNLSAERKMRRNKVSFVENEGGCLFVEHCNIPITKFLPKGGIVFRTYQMVEGNFRMSTVIPVIGIPQLFCDMPLDQLKIAQHHLSSLVNCNFPSALENDYAHQLDCLYGYQKSSTKSSTHVFVLERFLVLKEQLGFEARLEIIMVLHFKRELSFTLEEIDQRITRLEESVRIRVGCGQSISV